MKKVLNLCLILLISVIFVDIVGAETYNNYAPSTVSCGNIAEIPKLLPKVISIIYNVILIAVPILLVVIGSLDLVKGVTASKEDDIKKGQQMFIKRLISAVLIFFVFMVVKIVISFVEDEKSPNILDCAECFINNYCN